MAYSPVTPSPRLHGALRRLLLVLMLMALAFLLGFSLAQAGDVSLAWDASTSPEVNAYRVHIGTASQGYETRTSVGNVTHATVQGLVPGFVYYFAVTAHDGTGATSDFSNEVAQAVTAPLPPGPTHGRVVPSSSGLTLRWVPPVVLPVRYAVYKRVPGASVSWVLVRLLDNTPPRKGWTDAASFAGQEWCYEVRAVDREGLESLPSNAACGVMPGA